MQTRGNASADKRGAAVFCFSEMLFNLNEGRPLGFE